MSKKFDKYLEAATDSKLLEPNWDAIIECTDLIRSGEVAPKHAMASIRKRINHENPHVVVYALYVLDACVKNCGTKMHNEVATRDFMDEFKNLISDAKYDNVKNKTLEMLQCWANAFVNTPQCKIIVDTHNLMKLAGFEFPPIKEADAMFNSQVAPDWQDGSECYRCRAEFGLITRKHHCRACGQIFCDRCSSKEMALPQFGIEKEVRVCDACFERGNRPQSSKVTTQQPKSDTKTDSEEDKAMKEKLLREKEEEELALAIALSQSEAEAKEQEKQRNLYSMYNGMGSSSATPSTGNCYERPAEGIYKGAAEPTVPVPESPSEISLAPDDPLAKYLNRDYWQQKKAGAQSKVEDWKMDASAPAPSERSYSNALDDAMSTITLNDNKSELPAAEAEDIQISTASTVKWCQELREQVGVMESRIKSNVARGRPVVNDTAIQGLFMKLTELHSQVLGKIQKLEEDRSYYESLQDHLAHIDVARSAVKELREESERRRQEKLAEEQRMRQAQMKQTLDMMRMKKHAMLLEQRDVALQRFQQQEMEMQAKRIPQQSFPGYYGAPVNYSSYAPAPGGMPYHPYYQQQQYAQPMMGYPQPNQQVSQQQMYSQDPSGTSGNQQHFPPATSQPSTANGHSQAYQYPVQQPVSLPPATQNQMPFYGHHQLQMGQPQTTAPAAMQYGQQPAAQPQYQQAPAPTDVTPAVTAPVPSAVEQPVNEAPLISFD